MLAPSQSFERSVPNLFDQDSLISRYHQSLDKAILTTRTDAAKAVTVLQDFNSSMLAFLTKQNVTGAVKVKELKAFMKASSCLTWPFAMLILLSASEKVLERDE